MKRLMKIFYTVSTTLLVAGLFSFSALAEDYSSMSTAELAELRGTMRNIPAENVSAFRSEWQSRLQQMTPEEQQAYRGRPENAPADGQGIGRQTRNSSGGSGLRTGDGQKAGMDRGNSKGTGNRLRGKR
jgi:hypothetical protein